MTAETEILQELVEAVNCPDWWTIGITSAITIVNAVIMVWLGWNQYKLQKRQTEAQEYNIYRKLFTILTSANTEIDIFLSELSNSLWEPYYKSDKEYLKRKQTFIEGLLKDLKESYVDFELKLSKESFNKEGYMRILSLMSRILQHTNNSLENGEAQLSKGTQTFAFKKGDEDKAYALHIGSHFKNGYMLNALMQSLERFIKLKKDIRCDDKFLEKIKRRCRID